MGGSHPLILGAGPAGCAAAIVLAQAGEQPLLLDQAVPANDQLCGGFLSWRTVAQLAVLGIAPPTLGAHRVDRLALFAAGKEAVFDLPEPSFGLSRRELDTALRQRALGLGARLEAETARGLQGTAVLGRDRRWEGNALFLATGKHDVRGLARPRHSGDPALGLRLRLPSSPGRQAMVAGRIELHLFAGGYAGIVLQEDGTANVCLAVRKSMLKDCAGDPAQLLGRLAGGHRAIAQRLGEDWQAQAIESVGSVPYGWIARDTLQGVFRLGDQAAVIPSLAGEGISIALASGALAARHFLAAGAAGAPAYQRAMAARAAAPLRTARLAWALAERPRAAAIGMAVAKRFPPLLATLMALSRIEPEPTLARRSSPA